MMRTMPQAAGTKRLQWLDAAKGIGVIIVVWRHVAGFFPFQALIIFTLPFFFFLSGVALNFSRQEGFLRRRVSSLVIPYFVFTTLSFLYWALLERHFRPPGISVRDAFLNIFYAAGDGYDFNSVLWFLPCLFVVDVLYHGIRKGIASTPLRACAVILLSTGGLALSGIAPFPSSWQLSFRLPWMLDTALLLLPFYAVGVVFGATPAVAGEAENTRDRLRLIVVACAGLALCFAAVFFDRAYIMNPAQLLLPALPWFYPATAVGIVAAVSLSMLFPVSLLRTLGRWSLVIICIHEPIKRIVLRCAELLSGISVDALRSSFPCTLLLTAAVILACVPVVLCINRWFPFLLGRKKKKESLPTPSHAL